MGTHSDVGLLFQMAHVWLSGDFQVDPSFGWFLSFGLALFFFFFSYTLPPDILRCSKLSSNPPLSAVEAQIIPRGALEMFLEDDIRHSLDPGCAVCCCFATASRCCQGTEICLAVHKLKLELMSWQDGSEGRGACCQD